MKFALLLKLSSTLEFFSPEQGCDFSWQHELTGQFTQRPIPQTLQIFHMGAKPKTRGLTC